MSYKLPKEIRKIISENTGLSYERLIKMNDEEIE